MVGNFSPREAFAIGGTESVRGYEEGSVGSGRSYVVGSGEISFPLVGIYYFYSLSSSLPISRFAYKIPLLMQLGPVDGAVFADYGSDLGSGPAMPGTSPLPFPAPIGPL